MAQSDNPLSKEEFDDIYSKVPRLTVEIVLRDKEGHILLSKRAIEPCKGQWHLPGGTVRFGEPLLAAVRRIAKRELAITVQAARNTGVIEYPSHYEEGLDDPVGLVFEVQSYSGIVDINNEASAVEWFSKLPPAMHADQDKFLLDHRYLHR